MGTKVTCPGCATHRHLTNWQVWFRCRGCRAHIFLPRKDDLTRVVAGLDAPPEAKADEPVTDDVGYPFQTHRSMFFWIVTSVAWVALGWNLALLAPWLGRIPEFLATPVHWALVAITGWLILGNLVRSLRAVTATGQPMSAFPLTVVQVLLFHLLFFQIAQHLGPQHYRWEQTPTGRDWAVFTAIHTVRAADLFDALDGYGGTIQPIEHASALTGTCLVAFHLIVDLFFIGLVMAAVERWRQGRAQPQVVGGQATRLLFGAWLVAWLTTAVLVERWARPDLYLWPADNLLRVVDVADVMQISGVRLHTVTATAWVAVLGFLLRLLLTARLMTALSRALRGVRMRMLGSLALSEQELRDMAVSDDPDAARRARALLARMDCFSQYAVVIMISLRGKWAALVLGIAILLAAAYVAERLPTP